MSALRYASPYHETILIDQGGAPARRSHGVHDARPVTVIGDMAPRLQHGKGETVHIRTAGETRRARKLAERAHMTRCGALMRVLQEPCARYVGHRGEHRSRYALDNNADTQRAAGKWTTGLR